MILLPDLRTALTEQGWDGDNICLIKARVANQRHRHLYLEVLRDNAVRLYIHPNVARRVPTVKAQTIDANRPKFGRSLTRWVSLACFALAEVWAEEDEQKALLKVKETRRTEALTEMLDGTGFTAEEFVSRARVSWAWMSDGDIRTKTPTVDGASVREMSAGDWDGRTSVRKVANLLTFLQQEGWR